MYAWEDGRVDVWVGMDERVDGGCSDGWTSARVGG